jgi:hypothetical protein
MNIFTKIVKKVVNFLRCRPNEFLRLVEVVDLRGCDGKVDESLVANVFRWASGLFRELMVAIGRATPITKIAVYEIIKDGQFADIFGSLSKDFSNLSLTEAQIVRFCEKHSGSLSQGNRTFLPFLRNGEKFVAHVCVLNGDLCTCVGRFEDDDVWGAELRCRVVVPQL